MIWIAMMLEQWLRAKAPTDSQLAGLDSAPVGSPFCIIGVDAGFPAEAFSL